MARSPEGGEFSAWSTVRQRRHVRDLAREVLGHHAIAVDGLRIVQHEFNATVRVDGVRNGRAARWALRLNLEGRRSPAETAAEIAWIEAIRADGQVGVAEVVRSVDGRSIVTVPSVPLGREVTAVVFEWLPARLVPEEPRPVEVTRLGRVAALLHEHAERWQIPRGGHFGRIDDPMMGLDDHLDAHALLDPGGRAVIREVVALASSAFDSLRSRHTGHPIHGDLHSGNLMTRSGRLWVIDFDDCGISHAAHDLAIAAYHLRPADLEPALRRGYE